LQLQICNGYRASRFQSIPLRRAVSHVVCFDSYIISILGNGLYGGPRQMRKPSRRADISRLHVPIARASHLAGGKCSRGAGRGGAGMSRATLQDRRWRERTGPASRCRPRHDAAGRCRTRPIMAKTFSRVSAGPSMVGPGVMYNTQLEVDTVKPPVIAGWTPKLRIQFTKTRGASATPAAAHRQLWDFTWESWSP
jgi:hypothetical protein